MNSLLKAAQTIINQRKPDEYYAIYVQRFWRYYRATCRWNWLKSQVLAQHRTALNLYHVSEVNELNSALKLYHTLQKAYSEEKSKYKQNIHKLQSLMDLQLQKDAVTHYLDEIVWLTSDYNKIKDAKLKELESKLTNPIRKREWPLKLEHGETFDSFVKEINCVPYPTDTVDEDNSSYMQKHDELVHSKYASRSDHGKNYDNWHNCTTYDADHDLNLAKKCHDEIKVLREQLNADIKEVERKRMRAQKGLKDRYMNRFNTLRYNYKHGRKELSELKLETEDRIVRFRVVLLTIGHECINARANGRNYIPTALLKENIDKALALYDDNSGEERYQFVEKYKKYWIGTMRERNKRLNAYFSQRIDAFDEYSSPTNERSDGIRPMSGLSAPFGSDEDVIMTLDRKKSGKSDISVRTWVIDEESEMKEFIEKPRSASVSTKVSVTKDNFIKVICESDTSSSSDLSDEISVDEVERKWRIEQWKGAWKRDSVSMAEQRATKHVTPLTKKQSRNHHARRVKASSRHGKNKLKFRMMDGMTDSVLLGHSKRR